MASTVVNVMTVPLGAFTKPVPSPRSALTWAVKVWLAPTRFVPFGVIWMLAFWKTFVASPPLGATRVGLNREGCRAANGHRSSGVTGHRARRQRRERDGAVAGGIGIRAGSRACPGGRRVRRAVGVGQRHVDVLAGERNVPGPVAEVLLESHGEGVRHADLVGGVRRDRDPRKDDLERLAGPRRTGVRGVTFVVRPERSHPGRGDLEREARRIERPIGGQRSDGTGVLRRRARAGPVEEPVDVDVASRNRLIRLTCHRHEVMDGIARVDRRHGLVRLRCGWRSPSWT